MAEILKGKGENMNKIIILLALLAILPYHAFGQDASNYEITINGETYDISLGRDYQITSDSGGTLQFRVDKKAVMTYQDGYISFRHKSDLAISSTDLGNGIRQVMTNTAVGTLVLIQEYSTMNPTAMINLMLQELTKEQRNYGYKMQKENYSKALKDGKKLKGLKATLKYNQEEEYWTVSAYGKKDRGFLVITKIDKEYLGTEKNIINLMWETLQIES
jgi:hypothetical protein